MDDVQEYGPAQRPSDQSGEDGTATHLPSQVDEPDTPLWQNYLRNGLLIVVFLFMLWLVFNVHLPSIEEIRDSVDVESWVAVGGFVGLYVVVALTPIPVSIMAIASGLLFGIFEGTFFSLIGVLLGSWGAYWLARVLGRDTVRRLMGRHALTVEAKLESRGFLAVVMLRLMPGIPYWPVNYGSGAFGVSQRDYLVASTLSVIPGLLSLVAIGAFIADASFFHGAVVIAAWIVVAVLTVWAYVRWRKQRKDEHKELQPS